MSQLVVASLIRNEGDRYLRSALRAWSDFADRIVILDDNSTDKTVEVARSFEKAVVLERYGANEAMWGRESAARRELWDAALENSEPGDAIFWLDADMVPMRDPREYLDDRIDSYLFTLYDLWGEDDYGRLLYRDDAYWRAHFAPRVWMIRRPHELKVEWNLRGVHCGHLPANWRVERPFYVPPSHGLLHYGYFDPADRHEKYAQYAKVKAQLSPFEWEHAATIVDDCPRVKPLFDETNWRLDK
jgi:glycosyltransferase involved in cell wall biosynthesis